MNYDCILIKYGELSLKGKNQAVFVNRLVRNIKAKLTPFERVSIVQTRGRLFIELNGQESDPVITQLKDIFGIVAFSPARKVTSDLDEIKATALQIVKNGHYQSFKIESKRADKRFPHRSQDINREVGGFVLANTSQLKVDVRKPDITVRIEVRGEFSYVYGHDILGLGGLPVGTSGPVMLLLSGGIDSPVAGFLSSKRGGELWAVHFHSYPFTSERAKQKVVDLAKQLTRFCGPIRLLVVPFTEVQTQIHEHCFSNYSITVMRRFMLRISEALAQKHGCKALVTGESLGQVASQTLDSMQVINEVTHFPILRPLIGMDKIEIMDIAKKIDTYETSILPYEDCCTVFLPKAPKTKPNLQAVLKQETRLDVSQLVESAVAGTELIDLSPSQEDEEFSYF